jgi:hypothetical protein
MPNNSSGVPGPQRVRVQRRASLVLPLLALVALLVVSSNTPADEGAGTAGISDRWTFTLSPYLWAAGIQGKTGTLAGLPAADVDQSFGDIFR